MAGEPRAEQIAAVADQVQEWVVEALWQDGQAVWVCPRTAEQVSHIGELPGPRPQSRGGSQRKRRRRARGQQA